MILDAGHSFEVAYNHYVNRRGKALPHTKNFIAKIRPTDAVKHMVWETLTHAEVGNVGF